jgi:Myb/SANT-like DNA-binding domain
MSASNKRDRCPNYSKEDSRTLVMVVKTFAKTIENKKTDSVTIAEKVCWFFTCILI